MPTREQARARLKAILDLLAPGASLHIDDRWMTAYFGQNDVQRDARLFAEQNHCAFRYEAGANHGDGVGIFGRAYIKGESDA